MSARERCERCGPAREIGGLIDDLRWRGFRRVEGEPDRVGRYSTVLLDPHERLYRIVWVQRRETRRRRRPPAREGR